MGAQLGDTETGLNSSMLSPEQSHSTEPLLLSEAQYRAMLNNWTNEYHIDDPKYDLLRRPAWRGLMMALYVTVILVGLIGNSIVVFVVCRNRKMQNVTNIFIANLALSDILLCACLPLQLHYQLTDNWALGGAMCKFFFTAWGVPFYGSVFTILLIAFDRYWLIVYPLRDRMSRQTALILLALNFMVCFVLSLPLVIYAQLTVIKQDDLKIYRRYCIEVWPNVPARKVFSVFMFLFQFCLPLLISGLLYSKIYRRLQRRPTQHIINHERKQKTNKILGAIVTLFAICWLPWSLHSLLVEMDATAIKGYHFKFVDMLLKLFAMSSACINPFLYCWLNENFRKELDTMAIRLHIYREPSLRRSRGHHQNVPQFQIQPMIDGENGRGAGEAGAPDACRSFLGVDSSRMSSSRLSTTRLSTTRISASNIMEIEPSNALAIEQCTMIHDNGTTIHDKGIIQDNRTTTTPNRYAFKAPMFGNTLLVP